MPALVLPSFADHTKGGQCPLPLIDQAGAVFRRDGIVTQYVVVPLLVVFFKTPSCKQRLAY